jgi:hypothetical protein
MKELPFPKQNKGAVNCMGCWYSEECPLYLDVAPYTALCQSDAEEDNGAKDDGETP